MAAWTCASVPSTCRMYISPCLFCHYWCCNSCHCSPESYRGLFIWCRLGHCIRNYRCDCGSHDYLFWISVFDRIFAFFSLCKLVWKTDSPADDTTAHLREYLLVDDALDDRYTVFCRCHCSSIGRGATERRCLDDGGWLGSDDFYLCACRSRARYDRAAE